MDAKRIGELTNELLRLDKIDFSYHSGQEAYILAGTKNGEIVVAMEQALNKVLEEQKLALKNKIKALYIRERKIKRNGISFKAKSRRAKRI